MTALSGRREEPVRRRCSSRARCSGRHPTRWRACGGLRAPTRWFVPITATPPRARNSAGLSSGEGRDLDHLLDTLDLERLGRVEGLHLAAIDRRAGDDRDLHPGHGGVGPEVGAAGAHVEVVDHRHVAADVLPLRRVLELRGIRAGRYIDLGRRVHHLAEVERPSRGVVVKPVVLRVDLVRVDAPFPGRRLLEHVPPRGSELAHHVQMMAGAAGAVRVLAVLPRRVVLFRIPRSLPDLHPLPVGFELVGEDHRNAGAHPLTHFRTAAGDGHHAVVSDGNEEIGLYRGTRRLRPRPRDEGARNHLRAEHHRARDAGVLQEVAPAEILYG